MNIRIVKSVLTLAVVAMLGVGATFAQQFQSDPVIITNSQMVAGDAAMKLCNNNGDNTWQNSISPGLVLGDLVPGGEGTELSEGSFLALGNDDGDLQNNGFATDVCKTYGADPIGSSDVPLNVIPAASNVTCSPSGIGLGTALELRVQFFNADGAAAGESDWMTLVDWQSNTAEVGDEFEVGRVRQVKLLGRLNDTATPEMQNGDCTFDLSFTGNFEVEPEE